MRLLVVTQYFWPENFRINDLVAEFVRRGHEVPASVLRLVKKAPLTFWVLDLWPETLQAIGIVRSKVVLQLVGKLVKSIYNSCDLIDSQSKSFVSAITRYAGEDVPIEYFSRRPCSAEISSLVKK